ncbi:MAG: hypothetical protein DBX59_04805 [Bacillota bacterium]|nr:MAG: hypothetical protein DBX59_04805 [Bacillota bacterium]
MAWHNKKAQQLGSSAAAFADGAPVGEEIVPVSERQTATMRRNRKRKSDTVASVITWVVWSLIFIYSISLLFLYGWILMSSLKNDFAWMVDSFGFPVEVTFDNYITAFQELKVTVFTGNEQKVVYLENLLLNSFIYLIGCGVVATIAPCIMAYAASKFNFAFNKVIDGIVIVTMILPIIGALPSEIAMSKTLGLYGHFLGMFFMKFTFLGGNYLYFKSAFKGVPNDFAEAAKVDGASQFRVMFQIMMPMVSNIFFLILLLQMMGFWGDWQTPMIYLPEYPTVAFSLYDVQFSKTAPLNFKPVQLAACVLGSIPTLIAFVLFKNKIMGGLAFGGLKG